MVGLASALGACAGPAEDADEQETCGHAGDEAIAEAQHALSTIDCKETSDTGYKQGSAFSIHVVTVDGKKVETATANAYYVMAEAAAEDGVNLKVVSGFRTMSEQQYLYDCYINCSCNGCNLAAKPGYSNHQSGHALDLNTSSAGVYSWLEKNASKFGFTRTVPSEPWHWEWWGGGPGGGPCGTLEAEVVAVHAGARRDPSGQADFEACTGESFELSIEMRNVGTARWVDLGSDAKHPGDRVHLAALGEEADPLTGKKKLSVNENANTKVLSKALGGEACNDAPKCRRTVFVDGGIAATAPLEPGTYASRWRLRDGSPVWGGEPKGFGPKIEMSFQVVECPDGPPEGARDAVGTEIGAVAPDDTSEPSEIADAGSSCAFARRSDGHRAWALAAIAAIALHRRRRRRP